MRQIGPSLFVGGDPYVCFLAAEIEEESRRRNLDRRIETNRQPPSDRFLSLLKERTTKPKRYGFIVDHSYYRFGDDTLISIYKPNGLAGVPDCKKFMVHLESVYVVDVARGSGSGTRCMDMLTEIAEQAGCVVFLFCKPFVWSCDGRNHYAMESFEQLWNVVFDDKWDVLYHRDSQHELTKVFYQRSGFVNMCLYDEWVYQRDKSEDLPFEQQFVYLPSTLRPEYRNQLEMRLKREGCEFCNRL
jgi:GNAT superfamily N-acetyltransferase